MAGLEIAVTSLLDAQRAELGGADSIEICAALSLGGLTPPVEHVESILGSVRIGVHAIVRPHANSFVYSDDDIAAILCDAKRFGKLGVKSVVFGACDENRRLNLDLIARVQQAAQPAAVTVHRALDESVDPERSLENLARMGVRRVLTAGPGDTAWNGRAGLARWIAAYAQHFRFVVSGGLRLEQLAELTSQLNAAEYHFGGAARTLEEVDLAKVRALRAQLPVSISPALHSTP